MNDNNIDNDIQNSSIQNNSIQYNAHNDIQKNNISDDADEQFNALLFEVKSAYEHTKSIGALATEFGMSQLKIRKLLITAGVFTSDICKQINELHAVGESTDKIIEITGLSHASVSSYLPYEKGVYNAKAMSSNAMRCKSYRERLVAIQKLKNQPTEEHLWMTIIAFQEYPFKTASGLSFNYILKKARNGEWRKELFINRCENSKSLSWSSFLLAFNNACKIDHEVKKPKVLGDIRGVSYSYSILCRFGIVKPTKENAQRMNLEISVQENESCQLIDAETDAEFQISNRPSY